ncbi:MAG: 5-deoxy-glucuronate isomerase [Steroidobacteraceae bacterium]
MNTVITRHRSGFAPGFTAITTAGEPDADTGISMGVLRLAAGERHAATLAGESALLLMSGRVIGQLGGLGFELARNSLFDDAPACLHAPAGTPLEIRAATEAEFTVYACDNQSTFVPRVFRPGDVADERRGEGQVGGRCLRLVRTIFDRRNSPPEAHLVLGEVVTLPGGWSSYPPHHHPQPEIYHYRFTHPQGFGHAELGEQVFKVRQFDTVKILAGNDHAQCAAPGYGMYYSWVIRHLPDAPYTVPEFTPEHAWTMQPDARIWEPRPRDAPARKPPAKSG